MLTDIFAEVATSMSRNKLRIALTGFSIAWGIFMLIILLGAGNGLLHGMMHNFSGSATNVVRLWPGRTSQAYKGVPRYHAIRFDADLVDYLYRRFPDIIEAVEPRVSAGCRVTYGQDYVTTSINGFSPTGLAIGGYHIVAGRTINDLDIRERRKVCLLNSNTLPTLFRGEEAVGRWVNIYGIPFLVVGVYEDVQRRGGNDHTVYAPLTTVAAIFKPDGYYSNLQLLVRNLESGAANEAFNQQLRAAIGERKGFAPDDRSAVWLWNAYENYIQAQSIFRGLGIFIWAIGLATLIAGVVGISNIMLITVKERTREFGIRKAIGASPRSIVGLVLLESVGITMLFGYIGMLAGIGVTQVAASITDASAAASSGDSTIFLNPTVDLGIVLAANGVMILAGIIAGYVPARRAVKIKPVEALAAN